MDRIQELKSRIKEARDAYYNLDPIISDQEFDALVDELTRLEPSSPEIVSVGAPVSQISVWEKVKHEIPMGSLNKANSESDIDAWFNKMDQEVFFVTHKIDGSSMELVYENGLLKRCVTRGDGITGEDVTLNVSKIPSIPKNLPVQISVTIRGEVVMLKNTFKEKYSKEYANPRNTAAGKVREKKNNGEACKDLVFIAYWLKSDNIKPVSMCETFVWLKSNGFEIPFSSVRGNSNQVKDFFNQTKEIRDEIPYEIDGLVVSIDNIESLDSMGELNMRPLGQIAWKFDAAMAETKIKDIKWNVGPTGRICPVAIVEPVGIGGVTITNISLHNLDMFKELSLWPGCRVLISRRNDTIPYIEERLDLL